jgi:flagellar hook-associated protein 3 FlgL
MRISTAEIFGNGINAIQRQQGQLTRTQEQLATGRRILSPSEDPGGAVQALKLRERVAAVEQYSRNATLATNRLETQESVLTQMGESLQRARELTVQAANASQTAESRAAIALELREISAGLLDSANTSDASGEYLFAGYRSGSRPFVRGPGAGVDYLGDGGQRRVAISPDRNVAVGDSGQAWMSIPRGNGVYTVTASVGNTGTGQVRGTEVFDPSAIDGGAYTLEFTAPDAWRMLDAGGSEVAVGSYAPGQSIDFQGRRIGWSASRRQATVLP